MHVFVAAATWSPMVQQTVHLKERILYIGISKYATRSLLGAPPQTFMVRRSLPRILREVKHLAGKARRDVRAGEGGVWVGRGRVDDEGNCSEPL
jgi:hypothetical protein